MADKVKVAARGGRGFDPVALFDGAAPWKRSTVAVLFLLLVLFIMMPELVFQGKIFFVPDTKAPISFSAVGQKALDSGTYPLWNPYIFCGMPSFSSLAYTPYVYPPIFIAHVLHSYLGFPEMTWLLLHYLMAGLGVYLLLRSFSARSSVSLLAGAVFMIMPNYLATGANGHGSQACAVAYMPYAILFAKNILAGRRRVLNASLLSIALGFQMLRGHVQISYYTFLVTGVLLVLESVSGLARREYGRVIRGAAFIILSFVLALAIASVLILPVREYAEYSIRGGGGTGLDYGYATGWSLHPKELLTFVFPWASGFGKATYWGNMPFTDYPNYLGVVTSVFALMAVFIVRGRWKWYLFAIAAGSTLVSFGRFFPVLYDPMFKLVPYFNKFRVPVMILIVQQLMTVVLMGIGIEEFLRRSERGELPRCLKGAFLRWALLASGVIFILVLSGLGGIRNAIAADPAISSKVRGEWLRFAASAYSTDLARTLFFFAAAVLTLFLAAAKKMVSSLVILLLVVLSLADLFIVDHSVIYPDKGWNTEHYRIIRSPEAKEALKQPSEAVRYLSGDSTLFRIFPVPEIQPGSWSHNAYPFSDNSFMISGIFSMGGYHAAKLKNYQDVMDVIFSSFNRGVIPKQILNMLGAKYFVSMHPVFREGSGYPLVFESNQTFIYENPDALPRAFMVDRIKVMPRAEALANLLSVSFDPAKDVILQELPEEQIVSSEGGTAEITEYSLNSVSIKTHAEQPCMMVLSEIDYPDWKATLDGRETRVYAADYCLRAVWIPQGDHEIVFRFSSSILKGSLFLSSLALGLSAAIAIVSGFTFKKNGG